MAADADVLTGCKTTWARHAHDSRLHKDARLREQGAPLPPSLELGEASAAGVMEGSFLAPDLAISWAAPAASASGTARFQRDATRLTVRAPTVDLSAALLLRPPPLDALRRVTTQARSASRFPIIEKKSMAVKSH